MSITKTIMLVYGLWLRFYDIPGYLKHYELKEGDVVIDCGAYSGIFTRYAAKKVGKKGKVIAFEPEPENFEILKQKLKGFNNVILIQKAIFNRDGVLYFKRHPFYGSIASTITKNSSKSGSKVLVTTIDNELEKLGISSVNFVKMDIEGAELEAVKGMEKILRASHPNLAIASYHKRNNQQTCVPLKKMLSKYYSGIETGNRLHKTLFAQNRLKK